MSEFTKGKWRYSETNNTVVINDDKYIPVAFLLGCSMFSKQEYQANGRLIAAAPEMYRLLKILSSINEPVNEERFDDLLLAVDEVRKVLSRIDGEEAKHEQA